MNTAKTLILATLATLSLGIGAAMAQEASGGYIAGPREVREMAANAAAFHTAAAQSATRQAAVPAASVSDLPIQYGSSEPASVNEMNLLGGGG